MPLLSLKNDRSIASIIGLFQKRFALLVLLPQRRLDFQTFLGKYSLGFPGFFFTKVLAFTRISRKIHTCAKKSRYFCLLSLKFLENLLHSKWNSRLFAYVALNNFENHVWVNNVRLLHLNSLVFYVEFSAFKLDTRNSKIETINSKIETRNSILKTRYSQLDTRNLIPKTRKLKLETRY